MYIGSSDGNDTSLIPGLHNRGVDTGDGVGEGVEIRGQELVHGEIFPQDIKKGHQPRRDILRRRQIPCKRQPTLQIPQESWLFQRMIIRPRACYVAHAQEARSDGVDIFGVEFVKVAVVVDENGALEGFFGEGIVADAVVGEVVEDFEGKKVARRGDVGVPGEYGAVDDFDMSGMAARRSSASNLRIL